MKRKWHSPPRRRGFTLVELLVVIAIIGILIALLLPAIQAAREAARRSQCANNLMELIVAVQSYESVHEAYPPGSIDPNDPIQNLPKGYHMGWQVQILPFIEQKNTFKHIDFSVGVYHKKNAPVRALVLPLLDCPSDGAGGGSTRIGFSNYVACHHDVEAPISQSNNGVFFLNSHVRFDDISDGTSHTFFLGERLIVPGSELGWISGTRSTLRNTGTLLNGTTLIAGPGPGTAGNGPGGQAPDNAAKPAAAGAPAGAAPAAGRAAKAATFVGGFSSNHVAGANFAFGDGRINYITDNIAPPIYQQLGHRADGKLLSGY